MKNSPLVRLAMAAGLYLLVMWGYSVLPNAQWFAAFFALIMSTMLVFWAGEAAVTSKSSIADSPKPAAAVIISQGPIHSPAGCGSASLEASVLRLDSLKEELTRQYAQFGRDQSLMNSNALGSWHGTRTPGER